MQNNVYPAPINASQPMKNAFTAIVSYFDNHTGFNRLASFYGREMPSSGEFGKGLGHMNDWTQNPLDGCWAIWRTLSASIQYDVALIAAEGSLINTYPSGTWQPEGAGFGIFLVGAYHPSGAWNGTTTNTGSDTFTTPWKSGSITTIRCNGVGGGNTGSLDATAMIIDSVFAFGNNASNIFVTGDNDITYIGIQADKNIRYEVYTVNVIGLYQTASINSNLPLVQFKLSVNNQDASRGFTVGSTAANSGGGGINSKTTTSTLALRVEYPSFVITDVFKQSRVLEEDRFWEFPVRLYSYEVGNYEYLGTLNSMKIGAFSASGAFRFYNHKSKLLLPVLIPDSFGGGFGIVTLPWKSSVLKAQEW